MSTTTLKPGGSATKLSLTNASAEKSRKMLEQMLAKKLSSSTKVPKTMTIKTGATKKSTATRSVSGGENEGTLNQMSPEVRAKVMSTLSGSTPPEKKISWKTAAKALTMTPPPASNAAPLEPTPISTGITESMTFKCTMIDPSPKGGYRKKRTYVKKSSCSMSSTPTKKSSCGASTMSSKRPMSAATKPKPKTAKK